MIKLPEELTKAISLVSDAMDSDIVLYNGNVSEDGYGSLIMTVTSNKTHDNILLILVTYGGDGDSAYRIGRFLQGTYKSITVYVPSFCKSAGTLIALSANRIIMSDFAELGPLDVQLYKRDELWETRSGLVMKSALSSLSQESAELFSHLMLTIKERSDGLVTFRLASELASAMSTSLMTPIFSQINPTALGEDYRNLELGFEYGWRLAKISKIATKKIVRRLVHRYPSHDFVIDKEEARELFEDSVEDPSEELYSVTALLENLAIKPEVDKSHVICLTESKDDPPGESEKGSNNEGEITKDGDATKNGGGGENVSAEKRPGIGIPEGASQIDGDSN